MTAYVFQQIAQRGRAEGIDASVRQRDARTWFRQAAQDVTTVNRNRMMNDKENVTSSLDEKNIGQMFMFFYDPKHKDTLPYYDTFPLIFLIGFKDKGFMGINLHYLPPFLRAKLMDSLYETLNNNRYDESTKLRVSYQILASASKFRYFKPCVKHYLAEHVQSNYLNIEPTNWDSALMLPIEQFKKASAERVWRESRATV
jgi:hypothetical protein